jgi:hypothetical protein
MFNLHVPQNHVEVTIEGKKYKALIKKFKSGSRGWYLGGKIEVEGQRVQLSMSMVIVGSKPPEELIDIESVDQLTLDEVIAKTELSKPPKARKGKKPTEPKKLS